jgi:3-phosphoshikimate 1-carboxyvinyltransferase
MRGWPSPTRNPYLILLRVRAPPAASGRPPSSGANRRVNCLKAKNNLDALTLPVSEHVQGEITLPGSKSISNRALLLAALARGTTTLTEMLDSDDTRVMRDALRLLGVGTSGEPQRFAVAGCAGEFPNRMANIFVGNAGTAARSLVATLALSPGNYFVDGVPRMRERPIGDLVDSLRLLGAGITYGGKEGFPPLIISTGNISLKAPIPVRGDVSSQFLTGLLLALPLVTHAQGRPATIQVVGELISKPYIDITLAMMRQFGVVVVREGWHSFYVPTTQYQSPGTYAVEGDASSASYFLAAGAIAGDVTVRGVGQGALQGDVAFAEPLRAMGATVTTGPGWMRAQRATTLKGITFDANAIPDAAMTLVPLALLAQGPTTITNIASWRVKETDRIKAMAAEARKFGAHVEEGHDFIKIQPTAQISTPSVGIDTYDDHRIAMCFSLPSLGASGVKTTINDPKCVNKTFPEYFSALAGLRA